MPNEIVIDFETYSECSIEFGSYKYSEHPSTEVLMLAYKINNEETRIFTPDHTQEDHQDFWNILQEQDTRIIAHNYAFEWAIWENVCTPKYNWPKIYPAQWFDTMHQCGMHGLPLSLDKSTEVLKLEVKKNADGKALIKLFSSPNSSGTRMMPDSRPTDFKRFMDYCIDDVEATYGLYHTLLKFKPQEQNINIPLTHKMNANGIPVDVKSADIIFPKIVEEKESYTRRISALTDGVITTVNQTARMKNWLLKNFSIDMPNFQADTVQKMLKEPIRSELPEEALSLLEMRANGGKSSTAKYEKLLNMASKENSIHSVFIYHGTTTGRLCLQENSGVWVKTQNEEIVIKLIQKVLLSDMVHDGVEWVTHSGVMFSGEHETIEYEGVRATSEHKIQMDSGNTMEKLSYLKENEYRLALNKVFEVSAVYKIINTINNIAYIGCSKRPNKRFEDHIIRNPMKHPKRKLSEDVIKYGKENFKLEILSWHEKLKAYEQEAIVIKSIGLNNLYNTDKGGLNGQTNNRHQVKRDKDFKTLYSIWKTNGIEALLEHNYSKAKSGYTRLKILMDEYKYSSKNELSKLIEDRKIQEHIHRSQSQIKRFS